MVEDFVGDIMMALMMIRRKRMRLKVLTKTKGESIPIVSMIRTIEIREEDAEDKDLDEEASVGNIFTT